MFKLDCQYIIIKFEKTIYKRFFLITCFLNIISKIINAFRLNILFKL